jgi:hypothetical protein
MDKVSQEVLQVFLNVVVAASAPLLVGLVAGALRLAYMRVKLSLSETQLAFADALIRQFVRAAEQYDLGGVVKRAGYEKKDWVICQAEAELKRRGVTLDLGLIADMVEAAVLSEINTPVGITNGRSTS